MAKTRSDFTDEDIRNIYEDLKDAKTKAERDEIYEDVGALPQAVAGWFRGMGLSKLGAFSTESATPKKRGQQKKFDIFKRKATSEPSKAPAKKRGRPAKSHNAVGAKQNVSTQKAMAAPRRTGTGLSVEAKEALVRLLKKLLDD